MITEDFINTRLEKDYNLVLAMKTDYRADVDLIEYDSCLIVNSFRKRNSDISKTTESHHHAIPAGAVILSTSSITKFSGEIFNIENDYFPTLISRKNLGVRFTNTFIDIGTTQSFMNYNNK